MMVEDAWGARGGVRFGDGSFIVIKAIVKKKLDDLSDKNKNFFGLFRQHSQKLFQVHM
jgi:hypothetical protein